MSLATRAKRDERVIRIGAALPRRDQPPFPDAISLNITANKHLADGTHGEDRLAIATDGRTEATHVAAGDTEYVARVQPSRDIWIDREKRGRQASKPRLLSDQCNAISANVHGGRMSDQAGVLEIIARNLDGMFQRGH